jgi:outer membrane protein, heavy metal efflux system
MRILVFTLGVLPLSIPGWNCAAQKPSPSDVLGALDAAIQGQQAVTSSDSALTLDEIEKTALAVNPEIEVAARRVAVARAHVPTTGVLDDPMAMYRGWQVPLQKPWDYNAAQNMFSLSRTFSGGGKRELRTSVAQSDVDEAKANLEQVRLEVRISARKAFYELLRAEDEMRVHDRHVSVAHRAVEAARILYESGKVPQQDMLKAQVALTRLAEHMIRFDQDAELARAELNTVLGRDPQSPIAVRGEDAVMADLPPAPSLDEMALRARPDLAAARDAAERSYREQALAKKAYEPDFTLSAGYMLMPAGSDFRNNYMIEGSMNLPWLNRHRHDAEIAEAGARATEQDAELTAMRNAVFGQIQQALVQAQAAQKMARLYHDEIMPQAEATLQSSVIAYENDKTEFMDLLDSQMTVVDADLAWAQAVGDFDARLADLELAAGAPLDPSDSTLQEVKP